MIYVTDTAKNELQKHLAEKALENHTIRLYMTSFGWGGPRFGLALDELVEGDQLIEAEGFNFVMERDLYDTYKPFDVGFSKGWLGKGFTVQSHRISGSC